MTDHVCQGFGLEGRGVTVRGDERVDDNHGYTNLYT